MKPNQIVYRVVRLHNFKGAGSIVTLTAEEGAGEHRLRIISPAESLQVINHHSLDGFEFGCARAGAAQLALAMLLDFTESKSTAAHLYQAFKMDHVLRWAGASASIDGETIGRWIDQMQRAAAHAELRQGGRL
jgi:hypothetical protein